MAIFLSIEMYYIYYLIEMKFEYNRNQVSAKNNNNRFLISD